MKKQTINGYIIPNANSAKSPSSHHFDVLSITTAIHKSEIHQIGFGSSNDNMKYYLLKIEGCGKFEGVPNFVLWGRWLSVDELENPAPYAPHTYRAGMQIDNAGRQFIGFFGISRYESPILSVDLHPVLEQKTEPATV